ncbi:MAG: DUF934 domain-containing protein [Alphaproteobacteria bacterium]|nr:DUF934 domain-containing protein [Alphaproteobacteria bacterium]
MPLLKDGRLVEDPWVPLADEDPVPKDGPVLVSLARWQAEREILRVRPAPVGVRLASDDSAEALADDLADVALVAVDFPAFADGRGYSTARLLRERYGFTGELRAVGNILRDQYLFLARCGFDAFEVSDARAPEAWRAAMAEFHNFYQPAADGYASIIALRHRRVAAAE